jgi:Domain of unknown function (DUF222)/HNH endonuclease
MERPMPGLHATPSTPVTRQHAAFERLEAEITDLWGHLNAATARFLNLLAQFDREKAYERHGLANTAQWLNWQCGIGTVAAREKVRVARALEALPKISAAFARGEISYSKVRAMTRVASAASEPVLLNVALHGTAAHVEKLVRRYQWTQHRDAAALTMQQHAQRGLHCFYDDAGMLVLQARLPAELGAVVRKAIEAAVEALREDDPVSAESCPEGSEPERPNAAAQRADALVRLAETSLADMSVAASAADRCQIVVHVDQAVLAGAAGANESEPHCCELDEGPALALDTARRLACDATLVGVLERDGEPLDVGRRTRSIPPALARALRARDGGCRFPGCTHTRFTEGHHVKHWANGGETKLGNLVTLCRFHHRLVHEGEFGLAVTDDGLFVFTRPDGRRLADAGERRFRGNVARETLQGINLEAGLAIDAHTSRCRWLGERMDYSLAIEGMQALHDRAAATAAAASS